MQIEDLKQELEDHDLEYRGQCHDCGTSVSVVIAVTEEGAIMIEGGAIYKAKQRLGNDVFFKCNECFEKDRTLRNYQECEVYSRAIGYLCPINQWNKGKKEEFKMRKVFKNTEGK